MSAKYNLDPVPELGISLCHYSAHMHNAYEASGSGYNSLAVGYLKFKVDIRYKAALLHAGQD